MEGFLLDPKPLRLLRGSMTRFPHRSPEKGGVEFRGAGFGFLLVVDNVGWFRTDGARCKVKRCRFRGLSVLGPRTLTPTHRLLSSSFYGSLEPTL